MSYCAASTALGHTLNTRLRIPLPLKKTGGYIKSPLDGDFSKEDMDPIEVLRIFCVLMPYMGYSAVCSIVVLVCTFTGIMPKLRCVKVRALFEGNK